MLTKILAIKNTGLLQDASGINNRRLGKQAIFYAENGKGKSTFASILRSCGSGDSSVMEERVTIDGSAPPQAVLMFGSKKVEYKDEVWSGNPPEVIVYDAEFVNGNVHTGDEVTSSQRANLLDFALGLAAMQARSDEQAATEKEKDASRQLKNANAFLEGLVGGRMGVSEFRALPEDPDVDQAIAAANKRIAALNRIADIRRLRLPVLHQVEDFNPNHTFQLINRTLEHVHNEAASRVAEHLSHLKEEDSSDWLKRGLDIAPEHECPFCGQDTSGVELIEMYRNYFDQAYRELNESFEREVSETRRLLSSDVLDQLSEVRRQNNSSIEAWSEYVSASAISDEQDDLARSSLDNLRDLVNSLFVRKSAAMTEAHAGDGDLQEMSRLWGQFDEIVKSENAVVSAIRERIADYLDKLDAGDLQGKKKELEYLELGKLRYESSTVAAVDGVKAAESKLSEAQKAKRTAREALNAVMEKTLSDYGQDINRHLRAFGAQFEIAKLGTNYMGAAPRVDYQIKLRDKAIKLNSSRPRFSTALSEGDKRTLGLAFFAASTLADAELDQKIVVVDDPMSSLDRSRRRHTLGVLHELAQKAGQLILLGHDEYFLRDARQHLRDRKSATDLTSYALRGSTNGYSDFGEVDLDELCRSRYLENYELVEGVVNGRLNEHKDIVSAAKALRPLLEGYLHRKYPGSISRGVMLGSSITEIEDAAGTSSPLSIMSHRVVELREMNEYACQFHHDTQPDYEDRAQKATQSEVQSEGRRILEFIYSA